MNNPMHLLAAVGFACNALLLGGIAEHAEAQVVFPREAGSTGGRVRSGPGLEHKRIDGLRDGDAIVLLEDSGVQMRGYPWFKIRFKNNREGYQWGGILCSFGAAIDGVKGTCDKRAKGKNSGKKKKARKKLILEVPRLNALGLSIGGPVQSGPGENFGRLTSLMAFEPVLISGRANENRDGFDWFVVKYRGGQLGYQNGALLCSDNQLIVGMKGACSELRSVMNGTPKLPLVSKRPSVYLCKTGLTMSVTFADERGESYLEADYGGALKTRLVTQTHGPNLDFSNGIYELRGTNNSLKFFKNGALVDECRKQVKPVEPACTEQDDCTVENKKPSNG